MSSSSRGKSVSTALEVVDALVLLESRCGGKQGGDLLEVLTSEKEQLYELRNKVLRKKRRTNEPC